MGTRVGFLRIHPVWLLFAVLSAGSIGLSVAVLRPLEPLVGSPTIPWIVLACGVAAAEAIVVHVHFRSEATTFSFLEVPLVLGTIFAPGAEVWLAVTLGAALSLAAIRRQPPIKAAFNTANLSLQAAVAIGLMHALAPADGVLNPVGWLVAAVGTTLSSWGSIAAILVVIAFTEGRTNRQRVAEMLGFGSVVSLTNTALALLAASLIDYQRASVVLLLIPIVVLFAAYRSYVSERAQRERVQFLYRSTSSLRAMDRHASIPELLDNSVSMFRAQSAYLFVLPSGSDDASSTLRFNSEGHASPVDTLDGAQSASVRSLLCALPEPQLLDPELAAELDDLCQTTPRTGLVGALRSDAGPVALFVVVNRLGDVTGFTDDDLALFSTLADQLSLALVNDRLEQAVSSLQKVEQELAHKATHDTLTGLADRSVLLATLDDALADGRSASLLYLDLDDFKVVNDTLGHQAGDIVLVETGNRLRKEVRPTDCVARLGGDEFAVALFEVDDAELIATRIIDAMHQPIHIAGHEVSIGVSIGLAHGAPDGSTSALIANADAAMYTAKMRGKGSIEIHDSEPMGVPLDGRPRTSLKQALDNDEIAVAYQPVVELATGETVGFEALARWRAPEGPIAASEFIDVAGRQGLIVPIDNRVMEQVLDDLPRVIRLAPSTRFVSMNLSAKNVNDADFVERVSRLLDRSGIDPSTLVVEITEPTTRRDMTRVAGQLAALTELGVRCALDDFGDGPGPTSVDTLRDLPIDIVKIGGSLVRDAETEPGLVAGLVALGRSLGLTVLAEGIESRSQRDALHAIGCELGQGYELGPPVMRSELHLQLDGRHPSEVDTGP